MDIRSQMLAAAEALLEAPDFDISTRSVFFASTELARALSTPTRPGLLCRQWPRRTWAVEGANGTGRPLSQRLLAQGEPVRDVPAKSAARIRVFDTGHARKTDAHNAHAILRVALAHPRTAAAAGR